MLTAAGEKGYAKDLASEIQAAHRPRTLTLVVLNRVSRRRTSFANLRKSAKKPGAFGELCGFTLASVPTIVSGTKIDSSPPQCPTRAHRGSDASHRSGRGRRRRRRCSPSLPRGRRSSSDSGGAIAAASSPTLASYGSTSDRRTRRTSCRCRTRLRNSTRVVRLSNVSKRCGALRRSKPSRTNGRLVVVHTLRRKDLLDLWDTTPDLAGNDLDVSRFIREGDDNDVQFYWRDFAGRSTSRVFPAPQREESCAVAIGRGQGLLEENQGQEEFLALVWNALERLLVSS